MTLKGPQLLDIQTGQLLQGLTQEQHDRAYDYKVCFESEHGKRVLDNLISRFHEPLSFDLNANVTMFNEGQRATVAYIRYQLKLYERYGELPIVEEESDLHGRQSDPREESSSDEHYPGGYH